MIFLSPTVSRSRRRWTRRSEWLPARLANARDVARQRHLSETDSAESELPQESARPSAPSAAIVLPHRELGFPLALLHHGLTRHYNLSWLLVDTYCCVMIGFFFFFFFFLFFFFVLSGAAS